jgi:hypothetical protein
VEIRVAGSKNPPPSLIPNFLDFRSGAQKFRKIFR